jgi:hydroxymethylglutaryl-CoA lyase
MLDGMGIETGIDLVALAEAGRSISRHLDREPASKVARAMAARRQATS